MARKQSAVPVTGPATDRVTLPRRGAAPVRMEARLVDEVSLPLQVGDVRLRLWQGKGRLAVEVVVTGPQGAMLDAATAPDLDGIADWLEALDPWAEAATPAPQAPELAIALWAEALRRQGQSDFRWLVGEALYRWQGLNAGTFAGLETAS